MTHFMGTHQNRLDAKGRVSVPAPFRAALRQNGQSDPTANGSFGNGNGHAAQLVLRPSHQHPCIEAWPLTEFYALAEPLNRLDRFSEEHDDLASTLYADSFIVETDKEGRIVLPDALIAHAGLTEAVVFMGMGRTFHIWEPRAGERHRIEARERTRARRLTLPGGSQQ
jgi:MraZ protein